MADQPQDPFQFFRDLWKPVDTAVPGFFGVLPVDEINKKIAELSAVHAWLSMNSNMLQMTIHTLEAQRAALAAMQPPNSTPSKP